MEHYNYKGEPERGGGVGTIKRAPVFN